MSYAGKDGTFQMRAQAGALNSIFSSNFSHDGRSVLENIVLWLASGSTSSCQQQ